MMKNAFFCTLKTFRSDFFIFLEKQLDKKAMVNSKIKIELISGTAVWYIKKFVFILCPSRGIQKPGC